MSAPELLVRRLDPEDDLPLPAYATDGAAGMDVRAAVRDELVLEPGQREAVPTGLAVAEGEPRAWPHLQLPAGRDRHGLTCLNTPGTLTSPR